MARAERVTRVNMTNSEFVQILEYNVGQYYGKHHDFIDGQLVLPCGPRVYTLFMYLSDVDEGGAGARAPPRREQPHARARPRRKRHVRPRSGHAEP
eukprot:4183455-Prymnesium_polylepis.3